MRIDNLSYPLSNAKTPVDDYHVSIELFSYENVYFAAPNQLVSKANGRYGASALCYADHDVVEGKLALRIEKTERGHSFFVEGELNQDVRSVKLRFDGLPRGTLLTSIDRDKAIDEDGLSLVYPEGWRGLIAPFLVLKTEKGYLCIRSLAGPVKEHRFYMRQTEDGLRVDVVYEEDACRASHRIVSPEIELFYADTLEEIYRLEEAYVQETYRLVPFEKRGDVPSWFKDISLVVTCHMEAYTGKIFHTYEQAKNDLLALSKRIPGKRILAYLPGWEGRYYYKYGNYTSDERLGGEEGLKDLVRACHEAGIHIMAMYGMTMVNSSLPGYETWGKPAEFFTNGGGHLHNGSVDWEGGHHCDSSFLRQLNVGVASYQDHLFEEIRRSSLAYDFDGCFLDIAACHVNDRNAKQYDGVLSLCSRLKAIKPDYLIAGEGFYDGLAAAMPLFQSGHTQGEMHYHDRFDENLFTPYCREFAHLCLGDPSRGSTGVHELGANPETETPYRKGILPTLTLIDGSLKQGEAQVARSIDQARRYAEEFLHE